MESCVSKPWLKGRMTHLLPQFYYCSAAMVITALGERFQIIPRQQRSHQNWPLRLTVASAWYRDQDIWNGLIDVCVRLKERPSAISICGAMMSMVLFSQLTRSPIAKISGVLVSMCEIHWQQVPLFLPAAFASSSWDLTPICHSQNMGSFLDRFDYWKQEECIHCKTD